MFGTLGSSFASWPGSADRASCAAACRTGILHTTAPDSGGSIVNANQVHRSSRCMLQCKAIRTWSLHAVAEVLGEIVHDVQQEREVGYIVHMNFVWVCSDGPQLIFLSILNT